MSLAHASDSAGILARLEQDDNDFVRCKIFVYCENINPIKQYIILVVLMNMELYEIFFM